MFLCVKREAKSAVVVRLTDTPSIAAVAIPADACYISAYARWRHSSSTRPSALVRMSLSTYDLEPPRRRGDIFALALLTPIVGAAAGLLGAAFRLALMEAEQFRDWAVGAAQGSGGAGLLLVMAACAVAALVAAWLVRRFSPYASGSGIPHVEVVLQERLPPMPLRVPLRLIPVKFFGGVLAIGSGLALGREGPSVQMGASIADLVGIVFRRNWTDQIGRASCRERVL